MKKLPSVSLIITACDEPEALELSLLSVQGQKQIPDEVIVSDYSQREDTKTLIDKLKHEFTIPLVHISDKIRNISKTAVLNKSISGSQSEYILQIDAGSILHPCFVRDHLQFARPMSFVTGGENPIDKRLSQAMISNRQWQVSAFSTHVKNRFKALHFPSIAKLFYQPEFEASDPGGCVTAYWLKDFMKVNGYNETSNGKAQEDIELATRFINNGIARVKLRFAGIRFHIFQKSADRKPLPEDNHTVEKIVNNKIKYSQFGLADLRTKDAQDQFIRSQKGKISATIITYNEEKNIEKCIKSLIGVADEIIVVDSYSEDETENICKKYAVTFIKRQFDGHIQQKQFALSQANYQYVLSLDADEYLSEELQSSIHQVKDHLAYQGYSVNRRNFYRGKNINHAGWYPDSKIRLFNKDKARWGGENPHDLVIVDNSDYTLHLKGDLHHDTLNSLEEHKKQTDNYAKIAARYKFDHRLHRKTVFLKMLFSPLAKFFSMYILKLGFLDGGFGFRICYEEFKYTYKKYRLLVSMYKNQSKT